MEAFRRAAEVYGRLGCDRLAIATYHQALVELGRYDEHGAEAWWRIPAVHQSNERYAEACACVERTLAEIDVAKLPWPHRFRLLRMRAGCLWQRGQVREAAALNEELAAGSKSAEERIEALGGAARARAALREFDKARDALERMGQEPASGATVHEAAQAYNDVVRRMLDAGRRKEALALCSRAFQRLGYRDHSAAQSLLRRLVATAGRDQAAIIDTIASLEGPSALAVASDEVLEELVPLAARLERGDDQVQACTHAMLADLLDEETGWVCLGAIVDIRTRQGRHDEALAAARAAYGVTGFESTSASYFARAVALVAHALRGRDGHLVSGNAFRRYQVYGPAGRDRKPGTDDDIANPLAGLKPKPEPELDRLFQAALDRQPPTLKGWRARGWIYLLWSKPKEALGAFKHAFALCPLDTQTLARAAQDVALGLKALRGTPVGMEDFAQFQRYGPNGPDGRKGTRDDLEDPLAGL
jgi:tetratricopeptide (TPR) repeat protein